MNDSLYSLTEAKKIIASGKPVQVAGHEGLLKQLPKGNWIGGTTIYFLGQTGGVTSTELIQILPINEFVESISIKKYSHNDLEQITDDYPKNGTSFIIIPGFSEAHIKFAKDSFMFSKLFDSPLLGWISGFDLKDPDGQAKVFNGQTGEILNNEAIVMHCNLPSRYGSYLQIVNPFDVKETSSKVQFFETTFEVKNCLIDGKETNFASFLEANNVDTKYPLLTDIGNDEKNVSFKNIDLDKKVVELYAPVFPGITYYFAKPNTSYKENFLQRTPKGGADWSCNCILNYLYSELEGKKIGQLQGPVTFGEIAYILLNQTCVYHKVTDKMQLRNAA